MEHKSWLSLLLIMTMMIMFLVLRSQAVCIEEERKALLEIKASLISSHGYGPDVLVLPTWVDNGECCDWDRVKCNKTTGHVTNLLLKNLKGNLEDDMSFESKDPSEKLWPLNISIFLHFEELGSLDLSWNYLDNEVLNTDIETLSRLEKLEILDLSSNFQIDNDILPSLTTLVSLKNLQLWKTWKAWIFPAATSMVPFSLKSGSGVLKANMAKATGSKDIRKALIWCNTMMWYKGFDMNFWLLEWDLGDNI
ncbi:hypothetical protein E3N88_23021 [Mikania micrantha]|uniref:Leucine-rich repeat-containing N-terminal plant-type domain-containing protein n=1 Tax=Mikania micrantha TaxID=192012 RepID=A0A5N6NDV2_9ASTR|nr:hypothetical protein E3N88_23021 [Mikania micrantha]